MPDNDKFKTLTCLRGQLGQDPLLDEIAREVEASSVLEAMKSYIDELRGRMDNNAPPYQKMARLFMAGFTPTRVEGHHDGEAVVPVAPWVGKTFNSVAPDLIRNYTEGFERGAVPTYLGINHFENWKTPSSTNSASLWLPSGCISRTLLKGEKISSATTRTEGYLSRGGLSPFTLGRSERFSSSIIVGTTWGIFLPSAISLTSWSK